MATMTMTAELPAAGAWTAERRPARAAHGELRDEELMERLSHGDSAALEALYDRYGDLVYSTTRRIVGDAHFAEDVSQEVFLRLWRQPEKYVAEKGRFVNWLLSVTRNRALDWLRTRRRRYQHETASPEQRELDVPAGEGHDPALLAERLDQRRVVKAALGCLTPPQRQVIELAYFGGLTQREVADFLDQPLGTVKTRVRAAMQRLRQALQTTAGAPYGAGASLREDAI